MRRAAVVGDGDVMNVDRIALAIGEAADVELVEACESAVAIRGRLREIVDIVIPIAIIEDDEVSICVRTKVNGVVARAAVDGICTDPSKNNVIARASRDATGFGMGYLVVVRPTLIH